MLWTFFRVRGRSVTIAIATLLLLKAAFSQSAPSYMSEQGRPPFTTDAPVEMGFVNLANGNLHLEIPLTSVPERAGKTFTASLIYDSRYWYIQPNSPVQQWWPQAGGLPGRSQITGSPSVVSAPVMGWSLVTSADGVGVSYTSTQQTYNACSQTYTVTTNSNFIARFPDGSKKYFPGVKTIKNASSCSTGGQNTPSNWMWASDSSGYFLYVTNYTSATIWGPDGSSDDTRDNNGNYDGYTSSGPTDSAGRQLITKTLDANGNLVYIDVLTPSGTTARYTLTYAPVYVNTSFGQPNTNECSGTITNVPWTIQLPNGTTYQFTYDSGTTAGHYGQLTSMTLPSGVQVTYGWSTIYDMVSSDRNRWLISRTTPDGIWSYTPSNTCASACGTEEIDQTVTQPDGNQIFYRFYPRGSHEAYGTAANMPMEVDYYAGTKATGTLLKQNQINYGLGNALPTTYWTTLPNGGTNAVSKTDLSYYLLQGYGMYLGPDITSIKEYDFGSGTFGPLLRQTNITYLTSAPYFNTNGPSVPPPSPYYNIIDKPQTKVVYDGAGNTVAETQYTYDGTSLISTSGTPAPNHDYTNFSTGFHYRGNTSTIARWRNTDGSWPQTSYIYDDLGNLRSTTDPNGNVTTYDYTDNFSDGVNRYAQAHVTKTTRPSTNGVSHVQREQYFWGSGQVAASCGENFPAATPCTNTASTPQPDYSVFSYDWFRRLLSSTNGDGGQTSSTYNDTTSPFSITKQSSITSTLNLTSTTILDGLGRPTQSQLTSDPQGAVYVDSGYDSNGRTKTTSNPYRSTSEITYGVTTYFYDTAGRITSVSEPDGSTVTTSYSGQCTTVTDEASKARKSCVDGLGRVVQVFEDPSTLNYETDYAYNALDNLLTVTQKGSAPSDSTQWRTRTFTYDSLSHLLTTSSPETGTITYSYDDNGNVLSKISPAPNQTSSSVTQTLSYCYDALNRLTSKWYTTPTCTQSSPVANYFYDQGAYNGLTITYGIGRRTGMSDGSGATAWSYDTVGRPLTKRQTISTFTKTAGRTYNLDGSIATISNPGIGRVIKYTWNAARRITAVQNTGGGINFLQSANYTAFGALTSATESSAAITLTNSYNKRLQPALISASSASGTILSLCYDFHLLGGLNLSPCVFSGTSPGNNGDIYQVVNNRDVNRTQNFSYDSLSRVQQAYTNGNSPLSTSWGETFTIDAWGNLTKKGPVSGKTWTEGLSCVANTLNQLTTCSLSYDAAGNVMANGSATYTYDAENRLVTAGGYTYTYDGDGQRVKKTNGSAGTLYYTDMDGKVLNESSLGATNLREYVYLNNKRLARIDVPTPLTVKYYFSDNLESASVITDANGTMPPLQESDYYPYGGEIAVTTGDSNTYKFTSKERDIESTLDYFGARHYASTLGRFHTPDPLLNSGKPSDPQTWNRYAYTRNNPLKYVDPNGLYEYSATCKKGTAGDSCRQNQRRFDDAVKKASELLKTLPKDSKEYKALQKALNAIGSRGDNNGVMVSFGTSQTGGPMERQGLHINVDWSVFDKGVQTWKDAGYNPDPTVAAAAEISHEGTHLTQPPLPMWAQNKWDIDEGNEREAYGVQSAVSQAGHSDDLGGVWNDSWASSGDKETLRQNAVKAAAHDSMESARKNYYDNGGK